MRFKIKRDIITGLLTGFYYEASCFVGAITNANYEDRLFRGLQDTDGSWMYVPRDFVKDALDCLPEDTWSVHMSEPTIRFKRKSHIVIFKLFLVD